MNHGFNYKIPQGVAERLAELQRQTEEAAVDVKVIAAALGLLLLALLAR